MYNIYKYKNIVFFKLYNQWINDILGGFKTRKEIRQYIDNLITRNKI